MTRVLEKPIRRLENNIKMDITEIGVEGVNGADVILDRDRRSGGWF